MYRNFVAEARADARPLVAVERAGAHAVVTLDDPDRLNPLSGPLTVQLHDTLAALAGEPELRAVVLTGRDPAFCAGGDLRMMLDTGRRMLEHSPGGAADIWRRTRGQFGAIARLVTRTDNAFIATISARSRQSRWRSSPSRCVSRPRRTATASMSY